MLALQDTLTNTDSIHNTYSKLVHKHCLVCHSENIKPLKNFYAEKGLVKCVECGFVFMERIPTLAELKDLYSYYSYAGEATISNLTIISYHALLDEFEKYRKTNRLLDVGSGRGYFLNEAKKRGWEVIGTEFSKSAIQRCKEKGLNIIEGVLDLNKFDEKEYDIITSFEVIEHINNPHQDMTAIHDLLRKGGLFYCTTPNFNSLMRYSLKANYNVIHYPEHLSYYTKTTLSKLIEYHGFTTVKFLSTGISLSRYTQSLPGKKTNTGDIKADENLRQILHSKWYLRVIKKFANFLFSTTSTGIALKGYFEKI